MIKKKGLTEWYPEFSKEAIVFTEPEIMVKLISTIDPRGWPHITLISSNRAKTKNQVVWGQFTEGLSKKYVEKNPKQGIFWMTAEMPFKFLQAKVKFSHWKIEGEDIEYFNKLDLMRYNPYMNIWKVFYNDVIAVSPIRKLSLLGVIKGILLDMIGRGATKTKLPEKRLNVIGYKLFKGALNPKFISYIDPSDGYPVIIPCIQLQASDHNRLIFPLTVLKEDLKKIPPNSKIAVFGNNTDLVSQLVNGTFLGFKKFRGIKFGVVEIEEIYNSCPPLIGKIYPEIETRPKVTNFQL